MVKHWMKSIEIIHLLIIKDSKIASECHIEPDWILVYRINNDELILLLVETGSHSDLF